jgi:hypothetical protein
MLRVAPRAKEPFKLKELEATASLTLAEKVAKYGDAKASFVAKVAVELTPPTAYRIPFTTPAPRSSRAVGIEATDVQVSVLGL